MKSYNVYRSSRPGVLECAVFENGKIILNTKMVKEPSAPVLIETANISLRSDYDTDQTLIPGVTKRTVYYSGTNLKFADIRWNRDETYTIDFGDDTFDAVREDKQSFTFTKDGKRVGAISRAGGIAAIRENGVSFDPSYRAEYDESLSQQELIMILVFPILYFGF